MNTPFRLDNHPRRPQPPLAPPPDRYFDQLPQRVMARVQAPADATASPTWAWLAALSRPMRTALASAVVLGGFAASFLLSPAASPTTATDPVAASLSHVSETALIDYLATNHSLEVADLAALPLPEDDGMAYFLDVSPQAVEAEVGPALEDTYF